MFQKAFQMNLTQLVLGAHLSHGCLCVLARAVVCGSVGSSALLQMGSSLRAGPGPERCRGREELGGWLLRACG